MNKKYVDKYPKCDNGLYKLIPSPNCDGEAHYDAPGPGGHWGNFCEACYKVCCPTNRMLGTQFIKREPSELTPISEILSAIEEDSVNYWEDVMFNGLRTVECPTCGETRDVEPDARYIVTCACGQKYKVKGIM